MILSWSCLLIELYFKPHVWKKALGRWGKVGKRVNKSEEGGASSSSNDWVENSQSSGNPLRNNELMAKKS